MTEVVLNVVMTQKIDLASDWISGNPILYAGQIGIESDTNRFKIGDGSTGWNSLPYAVPKKIAVNNPAITVTGGMVTWAITHNLNTNDVVVSVYDIATNEQVFVDVVITSATVATLTWAATSNIAADTYRAVIIG